MTSALFRSSGSGGAALLALTCWLGGAPAARPQDAASIYADPAVQVPETEIDRLVAAPLAAHGIQPALCSDAVFIRRAFLDVIGTLPTAGETQAFLANRDPGRRAALVEHLLERPEFADYWAMRWSDTLRVKAEFPVNLWPNAAQAYHHWIRTSIRDNKPYDRFVRELLTSNGSNFRVGPVNFYRAMQNKNADGIARTVALTFLGTRAESWPEATLKGLEPFFDQVSYKPTREWKEEIVFWNPDRELAAAMSNAVARATNGAPPAVAFTPTPREGVLPDGTRLALPPDRDPRELFADWLITPTNRWFAPVAVNRIWAWLLGRGIVHEPDDFRPDNPPSNPALLDHLAREFVAHRFDTRHIYRLILNSRTYHFASVAAPAPAAGAGALFAAYPLRRLDAEVLIDAINKVTGSSDLYTSPIPEPFTFIPETQTAVALPDGSISSPFLELFGRPARATGMDNERANRPLPAQHMYLLNASQIQRKIETSPLILSLPATGLKREHADTLYLAILSRPPTDRERDAAVAYAKTGVAKGREALVDLAWALINSDEFLFRH